MSKNERKALEDEMFKLRNMYLLTDESPENKAIGERLRQVRAELGMKAPKRKKTWLDDSCREYAEYLN